MPRHRRKRSPLQLLAGSDTQMIEWNIPRSIARMMDIARFGRVEHLHQTEPRIDSFGYGGHTVGIDIGQSHRWIVAELGRQRRPIAESMTALIDQCESVHPHPDWAKLRALTYSDLSSLLDWVQVPFRDEPPATPLKGLWFGLFNPCPDGRTPVADIYVCGSQQFDPDPDDNSWSVDPDWWPEARCANSAVLADIYRIVYRQGASVAEREGCLGNDGEYALVLGYGAFAVRELFGKIEPSLLLGGSPSLGVAVGFDSGDFVLIGKLGQDGLTPIE